MEEEEIYIYVGMPNSTREKETFIERQLKAEKRFERIEKFMIGLNIFSIILSTISLVLSIVMSLF